MTSRKNLPPDVFSVLYEDGTERAFSHPLYAETRAGKYLCAGCGQLLFLSDAKYDSGTGWPSFYKAVAGAFETRTDNRLPVERTEYHCARCGGHMGHLFPDGPAPTGLRYCNNGLALTFVPDPPEK